MAQEEIDRAKWTQAAREAYYKDHPENFAGPDMSYPIKDASDIGDAWNLAGHAENPDAVRSKIKSIAKRLGLTDVLPDTAKEDEKRASLPTTALLYAPIIRIDAGKREVEGVATSEAVDSYGTIFSYEASKQAFQRWIGRTANVREMHDRRAVGKGIGVQFDDANKQVIVRSRVSRGAEDTWIKIQEGVLSGYSVGAINPVWGQIERDGKTYPYLTSYDLAELSYVDNASNPDGQSLAICRADGLLTEVVDISESETEQASVSSEAGATVPPVLERAGARLSADSRTALHTIRDQAMQCCNCEECQRMLAGYDEPDGDEAMAERMQSILERVLDRVLAPIYTRQQQFLARLASHTTPETDFTPLHQRLEALERSITTTLERVATSSNLDAVRADLSAVKDQVERIAAQPAPGGPVLNGARPAEKILAIDPPAYASTADNTLAVLERLQQAGALNTIEKQVAAAALAVQPTRGRMP